ncbi:MAG: hypothetical protein AB7F28_04675 [Candidatus Margulisiibacteriota bacterium]
MKRFIIALLLLCHVPLFALGYKEPMAEANAAPLQFSVFDGMAIPQPQMVKGLRINLPYGKVGFMTGIDLGIYNETTEKQVGIELGLVNIAPKSFGFRLGLLNASEDTFGLHLGLIQLAKNANSPSLSLLYNSATNKSHGPQFAAWNSAGDNLGLQIGLLNTAIQTYGIQFGLINFSEKKLSGIQIGLLNFSEGGFIPMPILKLP